MDSFVASVVIAALAISRWAEFTRLGAVTDVHLPTAPAASRYSPQSGALGRMYPERGLNQCWGYLEPTACKFHELDLYFGFSMRLPFLLPFTRIDIKHEQRGSVRSIR